MGALNMNMNMNMTVPGLGLPAGPPTQVRFNTADYRKLVKNPPSWPLTVNQTPLPKFPESWDPDLRSYIYLNEFVVGSVTALGPLGWGPTLKAVADPFKPDATTYEHQLAIVLDEAPDRDDRFAEIIHQNDADGAISYFLGMLMIDPARHKNTYLLIRVARRIGELVTMGLKGLYMVPRPPQLCPAIVPMIDPPVTPSYPAGHALEAHLIAKCLIETWAKNPVRAARVDLLKYLAHRIGKNRVIAGIHYPLDIEGGEKVAGACYGLMDTPNCPLFQQLLTDAHGESLL